jgi:hypothetical protein
MLICYFDNIILVESRGKAVTTLNVELGVDSVDEQEVKILKHFKILFECESQRTSLDSLFEKYGAY